MSSRYTRSRESWLTETTHSTGVGPVQLDVKMARRHGWSDAQLHRARRMLAAISRREGALAHRNGPVPGCPCVCCDPRVPDDLVDAPDRRESWRRRGLWPPRGQQK